MAHISLSNPNFRVLSSSSISNPRALKLLHFFCTAPEQIPDGSPRDPAASSDTAAPQPRRRAAAAANGAGQVVRRTPRGTRRNKEKLEDVICRMMASREWTTRLQNSIRLLVPEFRSSLVWNVLNGTEKSDRALNFFRWVERAGLFRHDRATHLKIIEILGRDSKLNHARCILLDMPKKGVEWDEDLFIVMIESYAKAGIIQESVKMFQRMKASGVKRTIKSYNVLLKVIMRRGRYMMAKRYFNAMLNEGIEPTRHTYNLLLWGFFLSLRLRTAKRFYADMNSRGISPDIVTYNTMINGFYRFKMMEEAEKFFTEMKGKNIMPNVISYTTMIKGYISAGRVDDALRFFEEMKAAGVKPSDITFSTLLPGLCDAKRMSEARLILQEMADRSIAPQHNSIFTKLLFCQCEHGDLDAAIDVLKAMTRLSIQTEAGHFGVLIENCCKAEVYDQAVKLLDQLVEKEIILRPQSALDIKASAYIPIIQYLCNHGQTGKAETFFRQLMKKGIQDEVAFNNLVRGHSKEGNPELANEMLKIMGRRGVSTDAESYKLLINSYLSKGEPADAKTALDGMIESGHYPDSTLFRSVMESLYADGRVQTASRVMKCMLEKGITENLDLVAKILEALFIRGHVEEALGRVNMLINCNCPPDFGSLLTVLCEKGKTSAAVKLLDFALEREYDIKDSSYEKLLNALLAAGRTLQAYSTLCKLIEKLGAKGWNGFDDLIKSLNEEGNTKQADILSRMVKSGRKKESEEEASGGKKGSTKKTFGGKKRSSKKAFGGKKGSKKKAFA